MGICDSSNRPIITINIEKEESTVKISVTDQGPGIPQEKLGQLFDRFYRVDPGGNHASGLGLGLYISYEIIKQHGGEIGVESELGKGSTFWFTLQYQPDRLNTDNEGSHPSDSGLHELQFDAETRKEKQGE